MTEAQRASTGIAGLDEILNGLRLGDNVVWRVDSIADYRSFVAPFVREALRSGRRVVYVRFAGHEPLVAPAPGVVIYQLDACRGFEVFAGRIHAIATEEGPGVFYVFDCLSDLLSAWATDVMIANFFEVTCPYLFELDTIAYFALMRGSHAFRTTARIRETCQVMIGLHLWRDAMHVHPLKVWQRHSPTMFLPHVQQGARFVPVASSHEATALLTSLSRHGTDSSRRQLDNWDRLFLRASDLLDDAALPERRAEMVDQICRVMIGREDRLLSLVRAYFRLEDLVAIKSRMLGTGFIGGKAVGMLLARQILERDPDFAWERHLERHDSFFLGSDVYYSFIVQNGLWKTLMRQKSSEGYFSAAAELSERMRQGCFPDEITDALRMVLEYFGQFPIVVRASSLLEDGFEHAFAGQYKSCFLANQGTPEERLQRLEAAIREVYASAMGEEALAYRRQRGLDQHDEQMAVLIQRVSGAYHGHWYLPELAGVGVSRTPCAWPQQPANAGVLRLVLGLGTRAVERLAGDRPRCVLLADTGATEPLSSAGNQQGVDVIDIETGQLTALPLAELRRQLPELAWSRYLSPVPTAHGEQHDQATFDWLLNETRFRELFQRLLHTLEGTFRAPLSVEFTVNFDSSDTPIINLLRCRPTPLHADEARVAVPEEIAAEQLFFATVGGFMGRSVDLALRRVIAVDGEEFAKLNPTEKQEVARLIGRINRRLGDRREVPTLLLGPGRWGVDGEGVPVTFNEIRNVAVLAEITQPTNGCQPELAAGTHFFQNLSEADIFYVALDSASSCYQRAWLERQPNALEGLMPASSRYKRVVKVCTLAEDGLRLVADCASHKVRCFGSGC